MGFCALLSAGSNQLGRKKVDKAERLRDARARRYATATDAATAMGIKAPTYLAHENGSRDYNGEMAQLYARKFGVSASWLMFGDDKSQALMPAARDQVEAHGQRKVGNVGMVNKDTLKLVLAALANYINEDMNKHKFADRVIDLAGYVATTDPDEDDIKKLVEFTIKSSRETNS